MTERDAELIAIWKEGKFAATVDDVFGTLRESGYKAALESKYEFGTSEFRMYSIGYECL